MRAYALLTCNACVYRESTANISYTSVRSLRSSDKHLLVEKVGRTAKGDRAFSVAAPKLWNRLDPSSRALDNSVTFKSELKTHYFRKAFK